MSNYVYNAEGDVVDVEWGIGCSCDLCAPGTWEACGNVAVVAVSDHYGSLYLCLRCYLVVELKLGSSP